MQTKTTTTSLPARGRGDSGVAATELAIVMPVMIVVVMLVFQVALFWHAKQSADVAAEEAVDAAQVASATEADGHAGAATILSQAGNLRNAEVTVTRDTAAGVVTATVTGRAVSIVPFGTWRVSARAQGSIEQFIEADER